MGIQFIKYHSNYLLLSLALAYLKVYPIANQFNLHIKVLQRLISTIAKNSIMQKKSSGHFLRIFFV